MYPRTHSNAKSPRYSQLLDVSENLVTIVEKLAFKDLYLATVNLSHNVIEKIEAGAFENCANITILDLSHNKLDNISKYAFDSNTYATELRLSYNMLTALNQVRTSQDVITDISRYPTRFIITGPFA